MEGGQSSYMGGQPHFIAPAAQQIAIKCIAISDAHAQAFKEIII